uniref:uncharacterized protein n=1 Tax=Pristiophorus japonicus TaxID=55135 RepID=UPI00398E94FD
MASAASLREENGLLHQELARVEDRLAQSQAERDELAIKYGAVSQRLEQALKEELGDPSPSTPDPCSLTQQNADLRRRMEDDQSAYKRKLQSYQEGQQRQALLVHKLQGKVVQYKKRCGDLEQQLMEKEVACRYLESVTSLSLSVHRSAPAPGAPAPGAPDGQGGAPGANPTGPPPPPPNTTSNRRLQQTQAQVEEVVDIMRVNVDKVLERDQKLSELDDRADALQAGASQFESSAAKLKRKYWWKNCKMMIMLGGICAIVVIVIVIYFFT